MVKTDADLTALATIGPNLVKHLPGHAIDAAVPVITARGWRRKDVLAFFECLPSCLIGMGASGSPLEPV